ncbi:MAG: bifunctional folylpolyglutamate synthase/dihydrofolate synthase, partial [Vicinamibacterales bacterium]
MTYDEAIEWLLSFADFERSGRFQDRPDVAPMLALLERLGNPHLGRATVHIAGSKGKGSVAAMVESILRAAAFRTGLYTSPHLHSYCERVQINGRPISEREFSRLVEDKLQPAVESAAKRLADRSFVTFDLLTALGFLAFREYDVDAQVIEVGLGGRVDSTNVFKRADVVAITPISLEHTAILGDTVEQIAREKAAIIRSGRTAVVVGPQGEAASEVIANKAKQVGAGMTWVAGGYTFGEIDHMVSCGALGHDILGQVFEVTRWRWRRSKRRHPLEVRLPLLGDHQIANAMTAVGCVDALGRKLSVDFQDWMMVEGLANVRWPGRMEVLQERPLVICDGAHNRDSARRLRETLVDYFACDRATFVIG